jgi:hypothetical protein
MAGASSDRNASQEIARLLAVGLDAYGMGEVSEAMIAWREVLRIDPHNQEARDYIQAADRRQNRDGPAPGEPEPASAALLREARRLAHAGEFEAALAVCGTAAEQDPASPEAHAYVDLLRSRLFKLYRARVGDLGSVPSLRVKAGDITRYNLPKDAGFVLSLVDGQTPLADVISLSGMDAFEALRVVQGLLDSGIVGLRA